jgi:hypothetical protein
MYLHTHIYIQSIYSSSSFTWSGSRRHIHSTGRRSSLNASSGTPTGRTLSRTLFVLQLSMNQNKNTNNIKTHHKFFIQFDPTRNPINPANNMIPNQETGETQREEQKKKKRDRNRGGRLALGGGRTTPLGVHGHPQCWGWFGHPLGPNGLPYSCSFF